MGFESDFKKVNFKTCQSILNIFIIIISLFIQRQNSTSTVTNVDTNEVETGMTRLIALQSPQCTKNIGNMIQVKKDNGTDRDMK